MTEDEKLAFRFDCGATWLNLLATKGRTYSARPVERLATPERLAEWLDRCELSPGEGVVDEDALALAHRLRETLRALALATVDGEPPPGEAVAGLTAFLAEYEDPVRLMGGERLWRAAPPTAAAALGRVARQAAEHLTGAERHALKVCPEDDCRGVFTDASGRRRWCPSPACASRGRVRAHRARTAK
ncbi:CGNR zinc finger domain-containing protein [Streptomyces albiaxialis]|uniref:CGNR zinc finger domain-containing protein n=1 Tax=Streptomyces albiaxialis TaxID=329523 RepID=A0ABN2W025_9ACTN